MSNYHDSASNEQTTSNYSSNISPSRRPDGSYRGEIRVRPGFVPQAERQAYAPPYRGNSIETSSTSRESLEDRVDSWADEEAPVLSDLSTGNSTSKASNVEVEEKEEKEEKVEEISTKTTEVTTSTPEARKPSQLATAIDTALDNLSLSSTSVSAESSSSRPIGRFAAQIANDDRGGSSEYRPYRRYDNNYSRDGSGYSSGYSNNRSDYNSNRSDYNSNRSDYNPNRSDYNSNRSEYNTRSDNRNSWGRTQSSQENVSNSNSNSNGNVINENRVENEFKAFLEELAVLRREMAVINAKLEYIRYMKARDACDLSEIERTRMAMEPVLISRFGAIFEAIEGLQVKKQSE
jgi:hypothetical protein